jgi:serine/threonine protein kinase
VNEDTAAFRLLGLTLPDGWLVTQRVELPPGKTGGACSVGYLVENDDGRSGFLKAFDYAAAFLSADPPQEFADLTNRYLAERELLELCVDRKLDRIVRILSHATISVPGVQPPAVSYLICELADGDARDAVSEAEIGDHAPMLRLAHHAAVGVAQLHSVGGFHHDLKPSNLLVWLASIDPEAKLGDLGCAFLHGRPAPQDDERIAGDPTYAPPERLYDLSGVDTSARGRAATDAYMFGGLICFLLTGVPYSGIVGFSLDPAHGWKSWTGNFQEVLPALVEAHDVAIARIEGALNRSVAADVSEIVSQLCHPDPEIRGHPKSRSEGRNPFALERYISRLNLLHRRASLDSRKVA